MMTTRSIGTVPGVTTAALALLACRAADATDFAAAREAMVRTQIEARRVHDPNTLRAMRRVPRHLFVPASLAARAYEDRPLSIGHDQTISQPYVVAAMTAAAALRGGENVLEVGTGSGYQAAVLAEVARDVFTIEIVPDLAKSAAERLARLGYRNVHVRAGDGYRGWPEKAPFHAIVVTASPEVVPRPLVDQLAVGGRLVAPTGPEDDQVLWRHVKAPNGTLRKERLFDVRFVPMTGEARRR